MASCFAWTSFWIYLLATVMFFLAFVTPFWIDSGGESKGLWMRCQKPKYVRWECRTLNQSNESSKFKVTQAMMCLALVCYVILCVQFIICLRDEDRDLTMISYSGGPAALFTLIAIIIFGAVIYHEAAGLLAWSYIMACTSCGLITLVTIATAALS